MENVDSSRGERGLDDNCGARKRNLRKRKAQTTPADLKELDDAVRFIEENTAIMKIDINSSVLAIIAPMTPSLVKPGGIKINFPDCNNNVPNSGKVIEVMNNMSDNVMETKSKHEPTLGSDMQIFAMQ